MMRRRALDYAMSEVKNMTMLPPPLGTIEVIEVYIEIDEPVFYLAKNENDEFYMVLLVDEDDGIQRWVFAFVSTERLKRIRGGRVQTRDIFVMVEGGMVVELRFDQRTGEANPQLMLACHMIDDDLPLPGHFLPPPCRSSVSMLDWRARRERCALVELHLTPPDNDTHRADVTLLAKTLNGFQGCVTALYEFRSVGPHSRGPIVDVVRNSSRLEAEASFVGSFGMTLRSDTDYDGQLFQAITPAPLAEVLKTFTDLLELAEDEVGFGEELRKYSGSRVIGKVSDFMKAFEAVDSWLDISWSTPHVDFRGGARLDRSRAAKALSVIRRYQESNPDRISASGQFVGVQTKSRVFSFLADDGRQYSGRIAEDVLRTINADGGVTVMGEARYEIFLDMFEVESVVEIGVSYKYRLVGFRKL